MKNLFKLIGVVLVAALLLVTVSCGEDDPLNLKGGTIEVTNGLDSPNVKTSVIIKKGEIGESATDVIDEILAEIDAGGGTDIPRGDKKVFKFDEDGFYTVVASPPTLPPFFKVVYLTLGSVQRVTVK
jgi:hypothetical protein